MLMPPMPTTGTDEAAQASYHKMYDAYARVFQRCGLKTLAVEADTGVMGGKFSHEFMVPAETGENEVVLCDGCNYAANVEKASSKVQSPESQGPKSDPRTSTLTLDLGLWTSWGVVNARLGKSG